jgi:hypothetical protein
MICKICGTEETENPEGSCDGDDRDERHTFKSVHGIEGQRLRRE